MSDISVINEYSDKAILKRIGNFIKQRRISEGITQTDFAAQAAISRSTLSLIERGENIALNNLIKILRMLDVLYVLDDFKVQDNISPLKLARGEKADRQRAHARANDSSKEDLGW